MYTTKNSHVLKTLSTKFHSNEMNTLVEPPVNDLVDRVVSMVILHVDKVLVQRHIKLGMLTIPSGKVDQDESIRDALRREAYEETGAAVYKYYHVTTSYRYNSLTERYLEDYMFVVMLDSEPMNMEPTKHYSQEFESIFDIDQAVPISQCLSTAISYLAYTSYNKNQYHWPIQRMADFANRCQSIESMAPEVQGYHWLQENSFTYPKDLVLPNSFYRMIGILSDTIETSSMTTVKRHMSAIDSANALLLPLLYRQGTSVVITPFVLNQREYRPVSFNGRYYTVSPPNLKTTAVIKLVRDGVLPTLSSDLGK